MSSISQCDRLALYYFYICCVVAGNFLTAGFGCGVVAGAAVDFFLTEGWGLWFGRWLLLALYYFFICCAVFCICCVVVKIF